MNKNGMLIKTALTMMDDAGGRYNMEVNAFQQPLGWGNKASICLVNIQYRRPVATSLLTYVMILNAYNYLITN